MRARSPLAATILAISVSCMIPNSSPGFYLEYSVPGGGTAHSKEFVDDYNAATAQINKTKSVQGLVDLLAKYSQPLDRAELNFSLGLIYGQRTGVVDVEKSVHYFTEALEFDLPRKGYIDALMLRGGASEQAGDLGSALSDYLRGLIECSQYDLSGGYREVHAPDALWDHRSSKPEDVQKRRDYRKYRDDTRFTQHVLRQRYYFVEAVKRVREDLERKSDADTKKRKIDLGEELAKLMPEEKARFEKILGWIGAENKRPWR